MRRGVAARLEDCLDTNSLFASFFFGMIGLGMFRYGKKESRGVPLGVGVALMVVPYFIPNVAVMATVCCGLMALPLLVKGG